MTPILRRHTARRTCISISLGWLRRQPYLTAAATRPQHKLGFSLCGTVVIGHSRPKTPTACAFPVRLTSSHPSQCCDVVRSETKRFQQPRLERTCWGCLQEDPVRDLKAVRRCWTIWSFPAAPVEPFDHIIWPWQPSGGELMHRQGWPCKTAESTQGDDPAHVSEVLTRLLPAKPDSVTCDAVKCEV